MTHRILSSKTTRLYVFFHLYHIITFLVYSAFGIYVLSKTSSAYNDSNCGNIYEWIIASYSCSFIGLIICLHESCTSYITSDDKDIHNCAYDECSNGNITCDNDYCSPHIPCAFWTTLCFCDPSSAFQKSDVPRNIVNFSSLCCVLWSIVSRFSKFNNSCRLDYAIKYNSLRKFFLVISMINTVMIALVLLILLLALLYNLTNIYNKCIICCVNCDNLCCDDSDNCGHNCRNLCRDNTVKNNNNNMNNNNNNNNINNKNNNINNKNNNIKIICVKENNILIEPSAPPPPAYMKN